MKRDFLFRIHPLLAAVIVVGAILAMLVGLYGLTRWVSRGEVMGRVVAGDAPLGGLIEDEARSELLALEERHLARPARFTIEGRPVTLDPVEAGFDLDEEAILEQAMAIGREGNAVYQFLWWLSHIFRTEEIPLTGSVDDEALTAIFDRWDAEVIANPASLGAVVIGDGIPQPVYPETGVGVDRRASRPLIETGLLAIEPENHELPTQVIVPRLSPEDIDAAVAEAVDLLASPISLVYGGQSVVFTPDQLTEAYVAVTVAEGTPQIVHTFDPAVVDAYLSPIRGDYEDEPVNAEFRIVGDEISIVPGRRGTRIDEGVTAQKLLQAGRTSSRVGVLPVVEAADPAVTTQQLESLGVKHLVSQFTTHYACCQDRVVNIQLMADAIDGAIVLPGQEFSINNHVGERTLEKGYLPAGTIVAGQLVDTVGGGVSQFATTMYNAVFWGGYEDVEHRPHSFYFSRYPEGIEATVNWRTPDLVFRNNSQGGILIDTRYTGTSITVRIFGDNDGRTVKGEQVQGRTVIQVVSGGGPDAIHVVGIVSERTSETVPPPPQYQTNPAFPPERVETVQSERAGWSVRVTRQRLRGGVELIGEETWPVTYLPQGAIYEVHPCRVPGQEHTCPTTTTIPTSTTTTTGSNDGG